jgi:hypothetical protein
LSLHTNLKDIINIFNYCIIGSSPIALLVAIYFSKKNKSVLVIEKTSSLGGAWGNHSYKGIAVEKACHLIEEYKNIKSIMQQLAGLELVLAHPKPFKFYCDKSSIYYYKKYDVIFDFIKISRCSIKVSFLFLYLLIIPNFVSVLLSKRNRTQLKLTVVSNIYQIYNFFKHDLCFLFKTKNVFIPKIGFSNLIPFLENVCKKNGVLFRQDKITKISVHKDLITLHSDEHIYHSDKVFVTQSVMLDNIEFETKVSLNQFNIKNWSTTKYYHTIFTVNNLNNHLPYYIHFPDHPIYHRLTRCYIDESINCSVWMVQTRYFIDFTTQHSLRFLNETLTTLNFTVPVLFFDFMSFDDRYCTQVYNSQNTGMLTPNFGVLNSFGDLSKNITSVFSYKNNQVYFKLS